MESSSSSIIGGLVIGCLIGYSIGHANVSDLEEQVTEATYQCQTVKNDYIYAMDDVNNDIEDNNNRISEARDYAWASYDDMGYMLENLEEIDTADDPGTSCY
jgi:thermostable 8-oxoguanine DNA glycosylase